MTIWNPDDCRQLQTFTLNGLPYNGLSLAFTYDSDRLITPSSIRSREDNKYILSIWDIARGEIIQNIEGPRTGDRSASRPSWYVVSADESLLSLTAGYASPVWIYDLSSLKIVRTLPVSKTGARDDATAVSFSSVGLSLAVGKLSGKVDVYEDALRSQGDEFAAYAPDTTISVGPVAFSPDGTVLATGALVAHNLSARVEYSSIKLWRLSDRKLVTELGTRGGTVKTLDWDPSGRYIAAAMGDNSLVLVAPQQGQLATINATRMGSAPVYAAAFSPDGQRLAAATERGLMIFRLRLSR